MKKIVITMFIAILACVVITGCGKTKDNDTQSNNKATHMKFEQFGIEYELPATWAKLNKNLDCVATEDKNNYVRAEIIYSYIQTEDINNLKKNAENTKMQTEQQVQENFRVNYMGKLKKVCEIVVLDKNKENIELKEKLFSQYQEHEQVKTNDNLEYYILYNHEYDDNGLSEKGKMAYKEIYEHVNEVKKSINVFKPIAVDEKFNKYKNISFKTKTIDGNEIDSSIFKKSKLTMINIWATFCGPCIAEMSDLQQLYEEVGQENINIIGIVSDTPDSENEALAKQILEKKEVEFVNIIPDETLKNGILQDLSGVPTTIFVDSQGNIIGEPMIGSGNKEYYKKAIVERLASLK